MILCSLTLLPCASAGGLAGAARRKPRPESPSAASGPVAETVLSLGGQGVRPMMSWCACWLKGTSSGNGSFTR